MGLECDGNIDVARRQGFGLFWREFSRTVRKVKNLQKSENQGKKLGKTSQK
jgi:hypothetical protein